MNRVTQFRRFGGGRPGLLGRTVPAVAAAALAVLLGASPVAADAVRDRQWYLDALNIAEAHQVTRGDGVTVAVVDSRAEITHPDLADNVLPGKDFASSPEGIRDRGHGVVVASVLAAYGHGPGNEAGVLGIAPEAKILPARAGTDPVETAGAIQWAADQGVAVVNISGGYGYDHPDLKKAVRLAQARDVVIVASAGNVTQGDDEVVYPAAYPGVLRCRPRIALAGPPRSRSLAQMSDSPPPARGL